jgi:hypothetical protein
MSVTFKLACALCSGAETYLESTLALTGRALALEVLTTAADGVDLAELLEPLLNLLLGVAVVVALTKALLRTSAEFSVVSSTYNVDGALPRVRDRLEGARAADVGAILRDLDKGVLALGGGSLAEGLGHNWDANGLELAHALEGEDGLDGDPALLVAGGEREEELVHGKVRVGEVEVDLGQPAFLARDLLCLAAFSMAVLTSSAVLPSTTGMPSASTSSLGTASVMAAASADMVGECVWRWRWE